MACPCISKMNTCGKILGEACILEMKVCWQMVLVTLQEHCKFSCHTADGLRWRNRRNCYL